MLHYNPKNFTEKYQKFLTRILQDLQLWDLKQDLSHSSYPDSKWQVRKKQLIWNIGSNRITLGMELYQCRPW
jgi:hypothetical protein